MHSRRHVSDASSQFVSCLNLPQRKRKAATATFWHHHIARAVRLAFSRCVNVVPRSQLRRRPHKRQFRRQIKLLRQRSTLRQNSFPLLLLARRGPLYHLQHPEAVPMATFIVETALTLPRLHASTRCAKLGGYSHHPGNEVPESIITPPLNGNFRTARQRRIVRVYLPRTSCVASLLILTRICATPCNNTTIT